MESPIIRHSELKELVHLIRHEVQKSQRPASEVILTDEDVTSMLKISKRKLQYLIADRVIPFHKIPGGPRRYFMLQDILDLLDKNRVASLTTKF